MSNPPSNPNPKPPPKDRKPRCGEAQAVFISTIRDTIKDGDPEFLFEKDWRRIQFSKTASLFSTKRLPPQSFYVKDLAVWVPHLMIPGYIPSCAKCGSKEGVDPQRFTRFVEFPKMLYGLNGHRYLDTVYYWCSICKGEFLGWHESTLMKDANELPASLIFASPKALLLMLISTVLFPPIPMTPQSPFNKESCKCMLISGSTMLPTTTVP